MESSDVEKLVMRLEQAHAVRIDRVESDITDIHTKLSRVESEVAALPGLVVEKIDAKLQASSRQPDTWKWAFGILATAIGGGFLLLWQADGNTRAELGEQMRTVQALTQHHTADQHPEVVKSEVNELRARMEEKSKFDAYVHNVLSVKADDRWTASQQAAYLEWTRERQQLIDEITKLRSEVKE